MLADNLTLSGRTGVDCAFKRVVEPNGGLLRIDTTQPLAESHQILVKHSKQGNGVATVDRHLVQASRTKLSATGTPRTAIVNLTVAIPRDTVVTQDDVLDLIAYIVDYISTGGFTAAGGLQATTNALDFMVNGG